MAFGKVTIEILDQEDDLVHYENTIYWQGTTPSSQKPHEGTVNIGNGISQFITYSDLERGKFGCQYLKNDNIYFRISKASADAQCKPWLICSP